MSVDQTEPAKQDTAEVATAKAEFARLVEWLEKQGVDVDEVFALCRFGAAPDLPNPDDLTRLLRPLHHRVPRSGSDPS